MDEPAALDERAVRGFSWTVLSFAFNKVTGVLAMLLLARLLAPDDFGLMALATLTMAFLHVFAGLGLGGVLLVRHDFDRRAQGTVLGLLLATGVVLGAAMAACSPLIGWLLGDPRVTSLVAVLAVVVVLNGFNWFYGTLLLRELEFRKRFFGTALQQVAFMGVALVLALLGAGVWSLVLGTLAGVVVAGAAFAVLAPYRVAPSWDAGIAREAWATGKGFLLQAGSSYIQENADYVAVGRLLGTSPLGFYSMAYRLGELTNRAFAEPAERVILPALSRRRHENRETTGIYLSTLKLMALISVPVGILLSATAEPAVRLLLGAAWLPAIGPLAVFGLWALIRPLEAVAGALLNAVGEAGAVGRVSMILLAPHVAALALAAELGTITTVALAMLGMEIAFVAVLLALTTRRAGVALGEQWRAIRSVLLAAAPAWVAARLAVNELPDAGAAAALAGGLAAGLAVYAAAVWLLEPGLPGYALRQARRALGRPATHPA